MSKYHEHKDALRSGRKSRPDTDALTVKDAANAYLNTRKSLVDAGELSPRTWAGYKLLLDELVQHLGKARLVTDLDPDNFAKMRDKLAKRWGPHRLSNFIQTTRSVFKNAFDAGLMTAPVRFGPGFKRPSKKAVWLHRSGQGAKLLTRDEVRQLIDHAGPALKAMILLGINCGFGNSDCGSLPLTTLKLDHSLVDFPRPKTGVQRRCPLWPETVQALREYLAVRPEPKDPADAGLVFVTKYGVRWVKNTSTTNPVSQALAKLLRFLKINGRTGLGFYTLRHTFRTIADESKDQPAADQIMGHESTQISSHYRERISDERLNAVTDHVRACLFGAGEIKEPGSGTPPAGGADGASHE